jgi:hypothetical protein
MFKTLVAAITATLSATAMSQTPTQFIEASRDGLAQQTSAHSATWHLGKEERWSADLDTGTIKFHFKNGTTASAPIQVVGTYNKLDGTFLWGWDHPSVPEELRKHAQLAKQWGEKNNVPNFKSRKVRCTEDEAWSFAAVANRLGNANGVYRGPDGNALVYMTFGELKLETIKP